MPSIVMPSVEVLAARKVQVEKAVEEKCANKTELNGTKHINASPGDFADICLVPGDPLRAKYIAETFLDNVKCVNSVRNALAFTGTYRGTPVSVMGTGMGPASNGIYYQELMEHFKVKNIIRVGSCGTFSYPKVKIGDIVIGMSAGTDGQMNKMKFLNFDHAPCCDYDLLESAVKKCRDHLGVCRGNVSTLKDVKTGKPISIDESVPGATEPSYHVGRIFSSDYFYHPLERQLYPLLKKHDYLAIEMECSTLYTLGAEFGCKTLAICTVSDELRLPENFADDKTTSIDFRGMSAKDRETTFGTMIAVALEAAIEQAK